MSETIFSPLDKERLINVNEVTSIMGVGRTYFSQKIIKHTNFLEIAPPVRLYGNGNPKYRLGDVLNFIDKRKQANH
jgi:predicted DNA-binding transcriptional regulator AlpA